MYPTTQGIYRYIFILITSLSLLSLATPVTAQQTDTTTGEDTAAVKPKKKDLASHQLTIGTDVYRLVMNQLLKDRYAYEVSFGYYTRDDYFLTLDLGTGGSSVDSSYLSYKTNNEFVRAGFVKSVLARDKPTDWDMMFIGLAAGGAVVHRGPASYLVIDSTWGNNVGAVPGNSFTALWIEINGGMRVELIHGLFAGWTARGKFLMNRSSFSDLSPLYIAGYGKGDKNSVFDINGYISYGITWKRKASPGAAKDSLAPTRGADSLTIKPRKDSTGNRVDSLGAKPKTGMRNYRSGTTETPPRPADDSTRSEMDKPKQ